MENMLDSAKNINFQWATGALASVFSLLAPIQDLLMGVLLFISIDFVVGCVASYKRECRLKKKWFFESGRAWKTAYKLGFSMISIGMAFFLEEKILTFVNLKLSNYVAGFICGFEFWSFLENAGEISEHPVFMKLRSVAKRKVDETAGYDDCEKNTEKLS